MTRYTPDNDSFHVSEALFGKVCRATPAEARELSASLRETDRARLALFCNARKHLREKGRAIASGCSLASLITEGGQAGYVLYEQVDAGPETWRMPRPGEGRVKLAHG